MNGKPAPLYRSWFKDLEWVRIALRIDSRSCYINPSSPPPPPALFKFPRQLQGSALFPLLLAVGNHLHPCMENFLRLVTRRRAESRAGMQRPRRLREVRHAHWSDGGLERFRICCYWRRDTKTENSLFTNTVASMNSDICPIWLNDEMPLLCACNIHFISVILHIIGLCCCCCFLHTC